MLIWAFESKSQQLVNKAIQSKTNHDELLKKSLDLIEDALRLDSFSPPLLESRAKILIMLENYGEVLKTVDLALTRDSNSLECLMLRTLALIKLEDWGNASKQIKAIKKLSSDSYEFFIKMYQSEIFYGQEKYKKAWYIIQEFWQRSPEEVNKFPRSKLTRF